jgi:hypothetical protein
MAAEVIHTGDKLPANPQKGWSESLHPFFFCSKMTLCRFQAVAHLLLSAGDQDDF